MTLKVYYDFISQPCRALILFLRANKIPHEAISVALRKGEQLTPEFSKINPFKKVPVIDHNGFVLTESVGILRYLAREFMTPNHWYPADSKLQARVDEFLEWQHLNIRFFGGMAFRTRIVEPTYSNKPVDQKKLQELMFGYEKSLNDLEEGFLKNRQYLCGNEITIADLLGACEIEQPQIIGKDFLEKRPVIKSWMERVKSQLQPHYDDVHKFCDLMADAVKKGKL